MSLDKKDIWADLRYALDELDRPPLRIHDRLTDAANLDAQPEREFFKRLYLIGELSSAYSMAKARADTRNAHEAIEKGLKAILLDSGLPVTQMRSYGHRLYEILEDVQKYNPKSFEELERCFNSAIHYLEIVTNIRHMTNIIDYMRENGKSEVFVANRYESIQGRIDVGGGRIGLLHYEVIRALLSLVCGWTPRDIDYRIETTVRREILTMSKLDPAWDAREWLNRGPARPRLEAIDSPKENKVLRAAVRKCARETKDSGVRNWANWLRHQLIAARREDRPQTS